MLFCSTDASLLHNIKNIQSNNIIFIIIIYNCNYILSTKCIVNMFKQNTSFVINICELSIYTFLMYFN